MTSVHQQLENRLIFLRLECAERWNTSGPPHLPTWTVLLSVKDPDRRYVLRKKASGAKKKDVRRRCMQLVLDSLSKIRDPCSRRVLWSDVSLLDGVDVALFEPPPSEWFSTPCSVGVDFEGERSSVVQIACEAGVAIDVKTAPWVRDVLENDQFEHFIFGAHESSLVANPVNLQKDPRLSLAETYSRACCPSVRFEKDKSIHSRVNWEKCASERKMSEEAKKYAALDAVATLRLGLVRV